MHSFYRRKGIAKKILNECIIFCHKKKVKKIILEVNVENDAAKKFYTLNKFKNSVFPDPVKPPIIIHSFLYLSMFKC